jgi:hypothetical protein
MRPSVYIPLAAAAFIVAYFLLKPAERPARASDPPVPPSVVAPAPASVSTQPAIEPVAAADSDKTIDLVVRHARLVSGPRVSKVSQGDTVVLHVTVDAADELHLHGYDLHALLRPNETATLRFVAAHSGRFDYELHRAHLELGAIEVYPRAN